MVTEAVIFKAESAAKASQLSGLSGKTFVVGKSSLVGKGAGKWLVLDPISGAGKGSVAIKLEGARQLVTQQISGLAGKTVTLGKTALVGEEAGKMIILNPVSGVAAKGAAAATATKTAAAVSKSSVASSTVMAKGATAGTIWSGTGLKLGLGLGLGVWGPLILVGVVGAGIYGYMISKNSDEAEGVAS